MPSSYRARTLRSTLWGFGGSIALHLSVLAVFVGLLVYDLLLFDLPAPASPLIELRRAPAASQENVLVTFDVLHNDMQRVPMSAVVDGGELAGMLQDPKWQAFVEPVETPLADNTPGVLLHQELMRIAAEADHRSLDENLHRLEDLSDKLTVVSSERGVSEVSTQINKLLGTEARAQRPIEDLAQGEFDFTTAQLHDVQRERDEAGKWKYTAILLDASGRTFESPLGAEEGESTYRTMQLIKSNPLLERVYRSVVLQMLDKVMKSQ